MMSGLEMSRIRVALQERFGLELRDGTETFDGGRFAGIRPTDLEEGSGFFVALARTPRQIEATFRPDSFAGALIRRMWATDKQSKQTFSALLGQARSDGNNVFVAVDGTPVEALPDTSDPWQRLDIDVSRRFPAGKLSNEVIYLASLEAASVCLSLATVLLPLESCSESSAGHAAGLPEGAVLRVEVNRYERSPANRAACIAHYGLACKACGLKFEKFYGQLGNGYIQVHHRTPVSKLGEDYFVNPITDLVPVCANCHAMLHRTDPPMTVEELAAMIQARHTPVVPTQTGESELPKS